MNVGSLVGWLYRRAIARRLEAFEARIGEVPAKAYGEMSDALVELTTVILGLVGITDVDCRSRTPQENIAHAVKALRGGDPIALEEPYETLQNIRVSVRELFTGLEAFKAESAGNNGKPSN